MFLDTLRRHCETQPDKLAIELLATGEGATQRVSYGQLEESTLRTMAWLRDLGLARGERLAVQLPNRLAGILLHLAACRLGAIHVPLNPACPPAELRHFLADSGAAVFLHGDSLRPVLPRQQREPDPQEEGAAMLRDLPGLRTCIALRDEVDFAQRIATCRPVPAIPERDMQAAQVALLLYTSGTTGRPKGAMISHGNLAANIGALHSAWGWRATDHLLHVLPLFHVHGLAVALHGALHAGATVTLMPRFAAKQVLDLLASGRFSVFMGVPTIWRRLLHAAAGRHVALGHLRLATSGSDRLPDDLFRGVQRTFGLTLLERYGMTETGMNLSNPLHGERRIGSVGLPLPGVEARIVARDDSARVLPAGEVGELQIRGPHVCAGYWRQPAARAATFSEEGWLRTGDLAIRATDGYYTLMGRTKDLVISGGLNVYPSEVERVLLEHDDVAAAAVIGQPVEEWGERVFAVIVPASAIAPGVACNHLAEVLRAHCRARLAAYKTPRVLLFARELPRNAMGKTRKAELRAMLVGRASWRDGEWLSAHHPMPESSLHPHSDEESREVTLGAGKEISSA